MAKRVVRWTSTEESKFFTRLFETCLSRKLLPLKKHQIGLLDACFHAQGEFDASRKKTKWYFVSLSGKYRNELNACYENLRNESKPKVTIKPPPKQLASQEVPQSAMTPNFKCSKFIYTFKNAYGSMNQQHSQNEEVVELKKELHDTKEMLGLISAELMNLTSQLTKLSGGIRELSDKVAGVSQKPAQRILDLQVAILGTLPFAMEDVRKNLDKHGIRLRSLKTLRPNFDTRDVENHQVIVFTRIVGHSDIERARVGLNDRSRLHYVNGGMSELINKICELAAR